MSTHPILTPSQLLDMQIDLLTRTLNPNSDQSAMVRNVLGERGMDVLGTGYVDQKTVQGTASSMSAHLPLSIGQAEAFYITDDLAAEIVRRAADEGYMPADRLYDHNEVPVPAGFVYIEGGLATHEIRGRVEKIHWLVWGPVTATVVHELPGGGRKTNAERALAVWAFNDTLEPDEVAVNMQDDIGDPHFIMDKFGRYFFQGAEAFIHGQRLGPAKKQIPKDKEEQYREQSISNLGSMPALPEDLWWTNTSRLVVALWDLLNESVNVVTHGDAFLNRPVVRRARRMNLPARVTVVKLRRAKYVDREYLGDRSVNWQHRWLVRRHRRWQACGPGRAERKLIWIDGYEKGPKDKPLIQSTKVYRLDR